MVPATRPQTPDFIEARFQNMPMMKTTNIGTLKNENSVWRYVMMLEKLAAMNAVPIDASTPTAVISRPNFR